MLMLLFQIGPDSYALDAEYVVEIFPKIKLKKIPCSKDFVAGLLNYGGMPIPVVDIPQLIIKRPSDSALHTRIILVNHEHNFFGLIAEKVTEIKELEKDVFIDSGIKLKAFPFLGGLYSQGENTIQFFNIEELFNFLRDSLNE